MMERFSQMFGMIGVECLKSSGETLELRGYGWFQWEDGKVIEAYNAFDPTAYNAIMSAQQ